jgi:hypothetical protein
MLKTNYDKGSNFAVDLADTSSVARALLANVVASSNITDGAILNADINANAAIAASKVANTSLTQSTDFGGDVDGTYAAMTVVQLRNKLLPPPASTNDGQAVVYDHAAGEYRYGPVGTSGTTNLHDLNLVDASEPSEGDVLAFAGGTWTNRPETGYTNRFAGAGTTGAVSSAAGDAGKVLAADGNWVAPSALSGVGDVISTQNNTYASGTTNTFDVAVVGALMTTGGVAIAPSSLLFDMAWQSSPVTISQSTFYPLTSLVTNANRYMTSHNPNSVYSTNTDDWVTSRPGLYAVVYVGDNTSASTMYLKASLFRNGVSRAMTGTTNAYFNATVNTHSSSGHGGTILFYEWVGGTNRWTLGLANMSATTSPSIHGSVQCYYLGALQ